MTRTERRVLFGILAVAVVIRVAWCIYAARLPSDSLHDPNYYYLYGAQLSNGNGYRLLDGSPTAYYPAGYAFSLAVGFWIAHHTPLDHLRNIDVGVVAAMNVLWQVLSVGLLHLVTRRLTGRTVAGYVAAGTFALWPNLIFHTAVALTESLFIFLLLVAVHLVVSAPWHAPRWEPRRLTALGLVIGAATLVRPVTIPIFPILFAVLLLAKLPCRRALAHTAIVVGCATFVLAPWVVRNAIVMNQVTLSTNTGDNLCMSRHVGGSGGFEFPNTRCFPRSTQERPGFETDRDARNRGYAIDFVKHHPIHEVRLIFRRLRYTFVDDADGLGAVESYGTDAFMSSSVRETLRWTANIYGLLAGASGLAGVLLLVRRRTPSGVFVVLTGVGMLIPPLVFFGDPRFHVPAVPIAAIGIGCLAQSLVDRRAPASHVSAPVA